MDAQAEKSVRTDVLRYVSGATSLREFRKEFALRTARLQSGSALGGLCAEIELLYGEYGDGFLSESELKDKLFAVANTGHETPARPSVAS